MTPPTSLSQPPLAPVSGVVGCLQDSSLSAAQAFACDTWEPELLAFPFSEQHSSLISPGKLLQIPRPVSDVHVTYHLIKQHSIDAGGNQYCHIGRVCQLRERSNAVDLGSLSVAGIGVVTGAGGSREGPGALGHPWELPVLGPRGHGAHLPAGSRRPPHLRNLLRSPCFMYSKTMMSGSPSTQTP